MNARVVVFACLIVLGCGTRKADVSISKQKTEITQEEQTKTAVDEQTTSKLTDTNTELLTEYAKDSKQTTTEKFDAITGKLTERSTTIETGDKGKTSNKSSTRTFEQTRQITKTLYRIITTEVTETRKDKSKTTTTDRNGVYYLYGFIALVALAFWLKPWQKKAL